MVVPVQGTGRQTWLIYVKNLECKWQVAHGKRQCRDEENYSVQLTSNNASQ